MKFNIVIYALIALHLFCVGCEFYVDPRPTPTYTHVTPVSISAPAIDTCQPIIYEPLYYDYCTEYDPYYGCTCVAFIDDYDWECRVEYCYYWDTCQWEYFDAYCIY